MCMKLPQSFICFLLHHKSGWSDLISGLISFNILYVSVDLCWLCILLYWNQYNKISTEILKFTSTGFKSVYKVQLLCFKYCQTILESIDLLTLSRKRKRKGKGRASMDISVSGFPGLIFPGLKINKPTADDIYCMTACRSLQSRPGPNHLSLPTLIRFCSILFLNAKGISFHSPFAIFLLLFFALNPSFGRPRGWVNVIDFQRVCHLGRPFRNDFVTETQRRVEPSFSRLFHCSLNSC